MLSEMSYEDFLGWRAFDKVSPVGDRRGDWQAASVCSAIFNSMAIKAGSNKRFATSDFLLEFKEDETPVSDEVASPQLPQDWQRMKMIARMFVKEANAAEKKRKQHGQRRR